MSDTEQKIEYTNNHVWREIMLAVGIFALVIVAAIWVGSEMASGVVTVWHVLVAATITAVATGFGALPFLFVQAFDKRWLGVGNALAAGLMLGASLGLIVEGLYLEDVTYPVLRLIVGAALGVAMVYLAHWALAEHEEEFSIGQVQGADAIKMLMIVGIMTAHSFAEGIGVGVSYGDGHEFGAFISIAIAIHNIPEGLAISLVLIPRGTSVLKASLWSMFSSLPQPLVAVPAFLFVLLFRPLLPIGLGLAAGAMIWMVFRELLPEALESVSAQVAYPAMTVAVVAMMVFQALIG